MENKDQVNQPINREVLSGTNGAWSLKATSKPQSPYYAQHRSDHSSRCLELRFRSGDVQTIPYGLLAPMRLEGNSKLTIETHGIKVVITGKKLSPLLESLKNEQVSWIRESSSGKDLGKEKTYVGNIEVHIDFGNNF